MPRALKRYTSLAAAIYMLKNRKITLLDPSGWNDRNDVHYMNTYREIKKMKTVLAACFTTSVETYHHWNVFTNRTDGVIIQFDPDKFFSNFENLEGIKHRAVEYKYVAEARNVIDPDLLPFLKRKSYKDEREYRILYEHKTRKIPIKDFDLDIKAITEIRLSPWIHENLAGELKNHLKLIDGCGRIKIVRSNVLENDDWINATDRFFLSKKSMEGRHSALRRHPLTNSRKTKVLTQP